MIAHVLFFLYCIAIVCLQTLASKFKLSFFWCRSPTSTSAGCSYWWRWRFKYVLFWFAHLILLLNYLSLSLCVFPSLYPACLFTCSLYFISTYDVIGWRAVVHNFIYAFELNEAFKDRLNGGFSQFFLHFYGMINLSTTEISSVNFFLLHSC